MFNMNPHQQMPQGQVPQMQPQMQPMHQQPHLASPVGMSPTPNSQRAQLATTMAKQHALASALRGGTPGGVPQAAPQLGINRPQGLPQFK